MSLLDVEGKLYEHMLLARLKKELERTGGLPENQLCFREGRQTIDVIQQVVDAAKATANFVGRQHRRLCAMITFDVKNAFNSVSDREIIVEAEGKMSIWNVNRGVPQDSVLGPTLWNV